MAAPGGLSGAFLVGVVVYALAWKGGVTPLRLVLIGIGLTHAMQALTTIMIIFGPIYLATQVHIWTTGSVNGSNWNHVTTLLPWVLLLVAFVWIGARKLNVQELGEDIARGVGSRVQRERLLLLACSTALAGGARGLCRRNRICRTDGAAHREKAGRTLFRGADSGVRADRRPVGHGSGLDRTDGVFSLEVPAGVFTSAIGAPYFIYLLIRSRN